MQREPHSLRHATEHGDRLRASVLEILVKLSVRGEWDEIARQGMLQVQHSESLTDHLLASIPKQVEDKRLSIDLAGLRSTRWEDDTPGHEAFKPYAGMRGYPQVDIYAFASG